MIYIDSRVGSVEHAPSFKGLVPIETTVLEFGDFAFEGNGPNGVISIGIERKALYDMLDCIETSRFSAYQLPGMKQLYDVPYLLVEGYWKCGSEGLLYESRNGSNWWQCKYRSKPLMYSTLYRYLISVSLAGINVIYSVDPKNSVTNILELYHYYQKAWDKHTALLQPKKVVMPTLTGRPASLVKRWAMSLDGIGNKTSDTIERVFKTGTDLANSTVEQWLAIPGIGEATAKKVVKQIRGYK
jgi:ERCC4-type nuclease